MAVAPEEAALTEAQWALIEPLLPSRRGRVGRPLHDHRQVLGGILWVARTGCSWREMPEEYGEFTTAYRRWRAWKERGLWQRILQTLGWEALPGPTTKFRKSCCRDRFWYTRLPHSQITNLRSANCSKTHTEIKVSILANVNEF